MKYKIQISTGYVHKDLYVGLTEREAIDICEQHGWRYVDENRFEWGMDYVQDYGRKNDEIF